MLALALILATSPLAESRGPSEHRMPATVRSEATAPGAAAVPELPLDKLLHASISANLVLGTAALARALGLSDGWAIGLGMGVSALAGVLKELLVDAWLQREAVDPVDLLADGFGLVAGTLTFSLLRGEF